MNRRLSTLTLAAAALWLAAQASPAPAETIVVDGQVVVAKSDVTRPSGGMTMKAVEARFGAPRERHATVGKPPITRWDYDRFAVFFEKNRVIDAVVTPAPAAAQPAASAAAVPSAGTAPAPTPAGSTSSPSSGPADNAAPAPPAPTPTPVSGAPLGRITPAAAPAAAG